VVQYSTGILIPDGCYISTSDALAQTEDEAYETQSRKISKLMTEPPGAAAGRANYVFKEKHTS
jgi:hypothetical protein